MPDAFMTLPVLAKRVLEAARNADLTIATAESCTGGLVIAQLTAIAGSSDVVDRGFVTYSNSSKMVMLGVPAGIIEAHGAVSPECASAMAEGALRQSGTGLAVAITGIAGPGGGSDLKPVGLVHFAAIARQGQVDRREKRYDRGLGRTGIRRAATREALMMLLALAERAGRQSV
jgi:nicotinamide-nucleotide amidase